MARRSDIDWEAIEAEYLTGSLSDVQLAKKHNISRSQLQSKAKEGQWRRDLSKTVEKATRAALIEQSRINAEEIGQRIGQESGVKVISAIEAAVNQRVTVLTSHQKLAEKLKMLAGKLYEELDVTSTGDPKNVAVLIAAVGANDPNLASDLYKAISLPSRMASAEKLANVITKTADLERKAHGIKDEESDKGQSEMDELLSRLNSLGEQND